MPLPQYSLDQLVGTVNDWCDEHRLLPASGQSGEKLTPRTVRYYRTMGLVSAPASGSGHGFGNIHRLQLSAIRLLQAEGFPLQRIQTLLFGRSENDLQKVVEKGLRVALPHRSPSGLELAEDWRVVPIDETAWLVLRAGRRLSLEQITRIQSVVQNPAASPEELHATI